MQKFDTKKENKKLVPLRRLADGSPYSSAYLSILVQRKKLKARKVGRNYFSTKEWFNNYLETHARDEKRTVAENKKVSEVRSLKEEEKIDLISKSETIALVEDRVKKISSKVRAEEVENQLKKIISEDDNFINEEKEEEILFTKKIEENKTGFFILNFVGKILKLIVIKIPTAWLKIFKAGAMIFVGLCFYFINKIFAPVTNVAVKTFLKINNKLREKFGCKILKLSYAFVVLIICFFIFGRVAPEVVDGSKNKFSSSYSKTKKITIDKILENEDTSLAFSKISNSKERIEENIKKRNKILVSKLKPVSDEVEFVSSFWRESFDDNIGNPVSRGYEKVKLKSASTKNRILKPFGFIRDKSFAFFKIVKSLGQKSIILAKNGFTSTKDFIVPGSEVKSGRVAGASEANVNGLVEVNSSENGIFAFVKNKSKDLIKFLNNNYRRVLSLANPVELDDARTNVYSLVEENEKEGVVVVPFETDEEAEEMKVQIENMFSDKVTVSEDDSGRAGVVKPVFGSKETDQKYLYMMVPLNEEK